MLLLAYFCKGGLGDLGANQYQSPLNRVATT